MDLNFFDKTIIDFFNSFAHQSWVFDKFVVFIINNGFFKGGVIITLFWWAWFKEKDSSSKNRKIILANLISAHFSMALARFLAYALPFRLRPMHDVNLNFTLPYGMKQGILEGWSSFPSDHAVLYIALATGIYFVSKRIGIFALLYTTIIILLPRIYAGYHYPTDIIFGALLGVLISLLGYKYLVNIKYMDLLIEWTQKKPQIFYPLFFLFSYQVADLFDGVRAFGNAIFVTVAQLLN